jgi:hypothetical protein
MYEVFDRFLRIDTWTSGHPSERGAVLSGVASGGTGPRVQGRHNGRIHAGKVPASASYDAEDHRIKKIDRLTSGGWAAARMRALSLR